MFKPVYKIRDGKSLLRLLKQHDLKGMGGILLEEVQESLPHCEKALKNRANEIVYITRPTDKKKVLFYNDRSANLMVYLFVIVYIRIENVTNQLFYSRLTMNFKNCGDQSLSTQWTTPRLTNIWRNKVNQKGAEYALLYIISVLY